MSTDRPLLGIALMLAFCILAPFGDALAKLLGSEMAVGQLVTLRFAIQVLILVPLVALLRLPWRMTPSVLALVALRTVLHIFGIGAMFTALLYLPIADAVAIAYVMPFLLLIMGHVFLGEEVGWRRIAACIAGFLGTLLVLQPALADVGWPALLPLAVALTFALFMLVTRQIAGRTDPIGMQAVSGVMAVALLVPALALVPDAVLPALAWEAPSARGWGLVGLMGVLGTLAHLLMTWSLRFAPAATLAPMQYLEIPCAVLVGWLIFGDLPGPMASVGIAVTLAAGLYIVMRERAMSRALRPAPAARPPIPPAAG